VVKFPAGARDFFLQSAQTGFVDHSMCPYGFFLEVKQALV
jgi:hypothetical protein